MNAGQIILKELQKEIPEIEYTRYIKQLVFDEDKSLSNYIVFYAPNALVAKWVITKYQKKIIHLFEVKTHIKPEIHIDTIKHKSHRQNQLSSTIKQVNKPAISSHLNPSYTFDNFVVGSSNEFAYATAKSVAEKPAHKYNPLFIYGGVGLGKTHLLQAIGNAIQNKGGNVIYSTVEQFINDFTRHIRNQTMDKFKKKYRECDILIIDDIQFLSGKNATQEEFFHTFNDLHNANKQIVLAADKTPKQIVGLEDRLKSRFEWGLQADIQATELETKIAIIQKKCQLDKVSLGQDIINYIATTISTNTREIEGMLTRLHAQASMMNTEITLDFTKDVLKEQIQEEKEEISINNIIALISKELNVKPSEIKSKNRSRNVVQARRIAIYLARTLTPNSMPQLASYFGMKDHSAVSYAMKTINKLLNENENFKLKVIELKNKIYN
jgi:chromosomal replication initiator protein